MTETEFEKGMALLSEAFPNRSMNLKLYFAALQDLDGEDFKNSIFRIVRNHKELYPDSNLIAIIRENISGPVGDKAAFAWAEARKAIISIGAYRTVSFKDKIINGVIENMGGWEKFCSMLVEEEPFRQKDFIALYEAVTRSGRNCPEKLLGVHERMNGTVEKVFLIGQEDRKMIESK